MRHLPSLVITLTACLLIHAGVQAAPIQTRVETTTESTHQWPDGPLKYSRLLATTWEWSPVGTATPPRYHGKVTRIELTIGGDGSPPVSYDSQSKPAKALEELPLALAGYAAWVGAELDFELVPGLKLINAEALREGLLDRLAAPNAPIREEVLALTGGQLSDDALKSQLYQLLPLQEPGDPHLVPGFPELTEVLAADGQIKIGPREPGKFTVIDLGTAKIQLDLTGVGTVKPGDRPAAIAPFTTGQLRNRTLSGTATALEKAPTMADLPASWPVTIQISSQVTSTLRPATP